MNFYISDYHFGHSNVLAMDGRPFKSIEEMENVCIELWNSVVGKNDTVYILGDMFWKPVDALRVVPQLRGTKRLIKGNHDKLNASVTALFDSIKDYAYIHDGGESVILSHFPIMNWNGQWRGTWHLHGHIHGNTADVEPYVLYKQWCSMNNRVYNCVNVGCMLPYMGYMPRTFEYLRNFVNYDYGIMNAWR